MSYPDTCSGLLAATGGLPFKFVLQLFADEVGEKLQNEFNNFMP